MKVHPLPKKRNITSRYDVRPAMAAAGVLGRQKKLRRLPHIFSKVLELPLAADADVAIEEDDTEFRFVAVTDDIWDDVRAHAIEIHPGVMKVVIRDGAGDGFEGALVEELELDRWRFRLPSCAQPSLASAAYANGELIVTIPKGAESEEDIGEEDEGFFAGEGNDGFRGGDVGRLVVVL